MRLLIVTDAWYPQLNGVVRSVERMMEAASACGAEVSLLTPQDFRSVPLPSYPEIRLALVPPGQLARRIADLAPTHIHITTEGPLGLLTRRLCVRHGLPFTTCLHTRLPDYVRARLPIPTDWTWRLMRRFHNAGNGVMVATDSLARELEGHGFAHVTRWSRGVDTVQFDPAHRTDPGCRGPVFLYVGRLAVEKRVDAFLGLDLPGTRLVVGDGPARRQLEAAFPDARFLGTRTGAELARIYASADVFVFPSRTDTFGMVLLEALASGLPIAAFPTPGPLDVIGASGTGVLDQDLRRAALAALDIPRERCRAHAMGFSWAASARQFFTNVRSGNRGLVLDCRALARPPLVERARRRLGWRPATAT